LHSPRLSAKTYPPQKGLAHYGHIPEKMGESLPSVYVKTLGCKVNTFDSHAIVNQFRDKGYELIDCAEGADVTVVNTCSVTQNADKEARYLARRFRRESPDTVLVFTGCYAQTDSQRLVEMTEVDYVVPNEVKDRLVDVVNEGLELKRAGAWAEGRSKLPDGVGAVKDNRQSHFKSSVTFFDKAESEQTRAFVKIQDGCDGFCSYCLIPYARGASRSVPSARVIEEITRLVASGCPEIVLTGIHIGDYGRDLEEAGATEHPIVGLIQRILAVPGLKRLRISSLEPRELSPALAELLGAHPEVVCDHMHLPLQSGSDRILKAMRRSYDRAGYAEAVARFRSYFPDASIGADVIPGFPGETEEEFEETLRFVQDLELSYLHVFPYSKRPNTAAARMPGHLDGDVVKARAARLRDLSKDLAERFARRQIGRTLPVLWEKDVDAQGRRLGHTPNYLTVVAPIGPTQPEPGTMTPAVLKGFVEQGRLLARLLS
jgi:threonylcarbamoyladenosine tRNA methylthiotransferase MtaB